MRILYAIAPFVFLVACAGSVPNQNRATVQPLPALENDTCDANTYANLIGQDATALERILLLGEVRVIRPNQAVTMDFRPQRINFSIGPGNRIVSILCN